MHASQRARNRDREGETQREREPERERSSQRARESATESHRDSPWLSLALSGSPWLSLAIPGSPWLSLALSGSLWLSLTLSDSLWLSQHNCNIFWLGFLFVCLFVWTILKEIQFWKKKSTEINARKDQSKQGLSEKRGHFFILLHFGNCHQSWDDKELARTK